MARRYNKLLPMNPKSVQDLDPKLKETYERVMGTSLPSVPAPKMETQPVPPPVSTEKEVESVAPESSAIPPSENSTVSQVFRADSHFKETEPPPPDLMVKTSGVVKPESKGNSKSRLMIAMGAGAVVFFAAYAVIWAKALGLF